MSPIWWLTRDGDADCLRMYERHYSAYRYRDGRKRSQFVGPGQVIVLRTFEGDAFFVWRKFIDDSGQQGVNCAAFRNESRHLSSTLVRQADAVADCAWPGERHYTFVDPKAVRSRNPGYCFLVAGWRRCRERTKSGLIILDRQPGGHHVNEIIERVYKAPKLPHDVSRCPHCGGMRTNADGYFSIGVRENGDVVTQSRPASKCYMCLGSGYVRITPYIPEATHDR